MKQIVVSLLLESISLTASSEEEKAFFDDHARGWHWYEKEKLNMKKRKPKDDQTKISATDELKKYQAQLEEAKALAVLHPTPQNVFNYQRLQYEMLEKASKFANVWMQNVYRYPELDYTQQSPVFQNARHIYLAEKQKHIEEKIRRLSEQYGLFFFFKKDCPYCEAFSPIVEQFSEKYGWDVLAVSEFGEKHELFQRSVQDNGLAENWGVNTYPSLFAVNPNTGHVVPVAIGMISIQEMEERIISLIVGDEDENEDNEVTFIDE